MKWANSVELSFTTRTHVCCNICTSAKTLGGLHRSPQRVAIGHSGIARNRSTWRSWDLSQLSEEPKITDMLSQIPKLY